MLLTLFFFLETLDGFFVATLFVTTFFLVFDFFLDTLTN
jgi:hypothetical protein